MPALAINALTLSHFRSHKRSTLETGGQSVAIFGPNGAGKTNILEAVSLLSPGRGLRRAKTEEIARKPESIGWKLSAEVEHRGEGHNITTAFTGIGSRNVVIDDTETSQLALAEIVRMAWLVPAMDRLWTEGAEGRRRFLDRMTLSFIPDHGAKTIAYEKAMRERNRLLKDGVRDPAWYGAIEAQMAETGSIIEQNRLSSLQRLIDAQETTETSFPKAQLDLIGPDDAEPIFLKDELVFAYQDSRPRDMAAGRTLVGPHRDDLSATYVAKSMPAKDCSTGEQKALLISLVLANGRALAQDFGAAPILLLDEVAAHLDADRRAALYDEIAAMGAQTWMTGTGAELFEAAHSDVLRIEVREDTGGSVIDRIS